MSCTPVEVEATTNCTSYPKKLSPVIQPMQNVPPASEVYCKPMSNERCSTQQIAVLHQKPMYVTLQPESKSYHLQIAKQERPVAPLPCEGKRCNTALLFWAIKGPEWFDMIFMSPVKICFKDLWVSSLRRSMQTSATDIKVNALNVLNGVSGILTVSQNHRRRIMGDEERVFECTLAHSCLIFLIVPIFCHPLC